MFANQKSTCCAVSDGIFTDAFGQGRSGSAIGHQSRPFSPYRHAPTQEDLLNAAVRGRALVIPPEPIKESSVASQSPSKVSSKAGSKPSQLSKSASHQPSPLAKTISNISVAKRSSDSRQRERSITPTRPASPDQLDDRETQIVNDALAARTPRTSYYEAPLDSHVVDHYHDHELCVLLQRESDPSQHEFVRKALRKAIRQRIKKLGMKYDNEVSFFFYFILLLPDIFVSLSSCIVNHTMIMIPKSIFDLQTGMGALALGKKRWVLLCPFFFLH